MTYVDPDTPYMKLLEPFLKKKRVGVARQGRPSPYSLPALTPGPRHRRLGL
jgi:hypothetical protein